MTIISDQTTSSAAELRGNSPFLVRQLHDIVSQPPNKSYHSRSSLDDEIWSLYYARVLHFTLLPASFPLHFLDTNVAALKIPRLPQNLASAWLSTNPLFFCILLDAESLPNYRFPPTPKMSLLRCHKTFMLSYSFISQKHGPSSRVSRVQNARTLH